MATLSNQSGRYVVQWPDARKRRHTLPVGRMSRKDAERIRGYVEDMIAARLSNRPVEQQTAMWLGGIGDALHAKLARHDLVKPRGDKPVTELGPFLERYLEGRKGELKERSRSILGQVKRYLIEHFGAGQDMTAITRGDAKDYRRYLASKLSPATVSMHVMRARMMFADAVDRRLIADNPMTGLTAGPQTNESRKVYVDKATVAKVIDACPDINWKLTFALARHAGLRTPSESHRLRWSDVLWDKRRMIVSSPKTEHHAGKDKRIVPITEDLMPLLREAFEAAPEGAVYVIGGNRTINPTTTARKIIARAGLSPWTKPFHNLRASCQTDWCDCLPVATVCAMIGNTEIIARKHYLMPKDEHFDRLTGKSAVTGAAQGGETGRKLTAKEAEKLDISAETLLSDYPRQDSDPRLISLRKLVSARKALQKALREADARSYRADLRALAQLEQSIAAARAAAGEVGQC